MMIASSRSARRAVLTMVLAAGLGLGAPAFADTRVGNDAYIRGDYETALREFTRAAERGDALAQFNLGGLYFEGRGAGPQRDYPEAARWFRAAAEQGLPNAQFNLAVLHYRGEGVNRDYPEMIKWMRLAADQQFAPALFQMGVIYENAIGVEANNAESLRWYRRAHGAGHPRAQAKIEGILAKTGIAYADQVDGQTAAAAARSDPRGNEALGGVPTFLESLPPARRAV
ncbi:MAG: sel1 repeat family protein, partial [Alphaproteobacteria bacterium]|nr:sel1 repeat family protein [Alphaproteobacteria bacterium]